MGHKTKLERQQEAVARNFGSSLHRELMCIAYSVVTLRRGSCSTEFKRTTLEDLVNRVYHLSSKAKFCLANPASVSGTALEAYIESKEGLDGHLRWVICCFEAPSTDHYRPHEGWISGSPFSCLEDVRALVMSQRYAK